MLTYLFNKHLLDVSCEPSTTLGYGNVDDDDDK